MTQMTQQKPKPPLPVCVTRCAHCALEVYGFQRDERPCPRCGRPASQRYERWIPNPHPLVTQRALNSVRAD